MTTIDLAPPAPAVIDAAQTLAGSLPDRSAEIEAARQLPADLLADLVSSGCFRILLPRSHGGSEATLGQALSLYEMLAAADPATGWTVMIGATGWCDLAAPAMIASASGVNSESKAGRASAARSHQPVAPIITVQPVAGSAAASIS